MPTPRPAAGSLADPDRLRALAATGLPDAPPDPAFERLTALVQTALGVPTALVSLVESERQVFAGQQGLAEPWCSLGETPISHSFCQHVVALEEPLIIRDARLSPLVQDNPAVHELGVIAYLGVPLRTPDGHTVGSLCAIDSEPRDWSASDLESMTMLADAAMVTISLRYRTQQATERLSDAVSRGRALFLALFDAAPAALVLRPTGAVAAANPAASALADLPVPAMLGLRAWAVLPIFGDAEDELRDAVTCAANGETATVELPVGGALQTLRIRAVPDGDGLLLLEAV